jgi:hypothetical protein
MELRLPGSTFNPAPGLPFRLALAPVIGSRKLIPFFPGIRNIADFPPLEFARED